MIKEVFIQHGKVFVEILFLRFYSTETKKINPFSRYLLYLLAFALFYIPIGYSIVTLSIHNHEFIQYFFYIIVLHILSKFILFNSKRIQQRFCNIREQKKFFTRVFLMLEYILLMWLVYLFYPLTCILFPSGMLLVFYEKLWGSSFFFNAFFTYTEAFILYGSLISYVLFIFADGYKKLQNGFLPDYLGLYAILAAMSGFIGRVAQIYIPVKIEALSAIFSQILNLSNNALNIVSSLVMFIFAVYSLYTTCGLVQRPDKPSEDSSQPE